MKVLIDNGHGIETPGKRSPDGKFREYKYAREIAAGIVKALQEKKIDAELLVPEECDVPLFERANRANVFCNTCGTKNVLLVSVHCNAAGNGSDWMNARGWEAYTTPGETTADKLAESLYKAAESCLKGQKIRKDLSDGDSDKEARFYILRKTRCAAVLTENLFQDNHEDVDFLTSAEGRKAIIDLHVKGIMDFIAQQ